MEKDKNSIMVISFTPMQKEYYQKYKDKNEIIKNADYSNSTKIKNLEKNYSDNMPYFFPTQHQYDSLPSVINSFKLESLDKFDILAGEEVYDNSKKLCYYSSENNKLSCIDNSKDITEFYKVTKDNSKLHFFDEDFNNLLNTEKSKETYQIIKPSNEEITKNIDNYLISLNTPFVGGAPILNSEYSDNVWNSIPNSINGYDLGDRNKEWLLSGKPIQDSINNCWYRLIDKYILKEVTITVQREFKPEYSYKKFSLINKSDIILPIVIKKYDTITENVLNSNINLTNNNMDYKVERDFMVNDPISLKKDNQVLIGKIESIEDDGSKNLKIYNNKDIKDIKVDADTALTPMFVINKEEKMVYLKFTFDEVKESLQNNKDLNVDLKTKDGEKNEFFSLMLGNKTEVMPIQLDFGEGSKSVEARLEMKRKADGTASISSDVKHNELNLDLPVYGVKLNDAQKEKIQKDGDLGLVTGFKTKDDKEFSLWVSLDKDLNKIVTKPEYAINLDMFFGVKLNDEQKTSLKSGLPTNIEVKGKTYSVTASAATNSADGLNKKAVEDKKNEKLETKKEKGKGVTR